LRLARSLRTDGYRSVTSARLMSRWQHTDYQSFPTPTYKNENDGVVMKINTLFWSCAFLVISRFLMEWQ